MKMLYYANHPLIKSQLENGAFTSLKNAFNIVMCLCNAAYSVFETSGEIAAVLKEAKQNSQNYEFLLMMCMFALATVIGCTINDSATRHNWDTLAKMFNCSINRRQQMVMCMNLFILSVVLLCPNFI